MFVCGAPVLPCAVKVRREAVEKYGIQEGWGESFCRTLCCPGATLAQLAMEVEEREGGEIGCCGTWKDREMGDGKAYTRLAGGEVLGEVIDRR